MMSRVRMAVVTLTAMVLGAAALGHAMNCEGRLITMGASPWDVQMICGDPAQVSGTIDIMLKPVYNPYGRVARHLPVGVPKRFSTDHVGPSRLLYLLTFLEEAVVEIDTGGYGH